MDKHTEKPESSMIAAEENKEQRTEERPFTLRKLNATDLFLMVRIISKIGINEFISCINSPHVMKLIKKFTGEKGEKEERAENSTGDPDFIVGVGVALEFANRILAHLPECQSEIFTLLGNVSGMSAKTVEALDAEIFVEMLVAFVRKEEFPNFIRVVSKYFKSGT